MQPIFTASDGNVFMSFKKINENSVDVHPVTHCLAVVKLDGEYILGLNKWRSRYEIFGGCFEHGESPRECISRECFEELGIKGDFEYLGIMEFLMQPDYFSDKTRIEYGYLYGITLKNLTLDEIFSQINDRDEIQKIAFYSDIKGRENISEIDELLLSYY